MKICSVCNQPFAAAGSHLTCSVSCSKELKRRTQKRASKRYRDSHPEPPAILDEKKCVACGAGFKPMMSTQICCTRACRKEFNRIRSRKWYAENREYANKKNREWHRLSRVPIERECTSCKKIFMTTSRKKEVCCSAECLVAWKKSYRRDASIRYALRHPDRCREHWKKYRLAHPEHVKKHNKKAHEYTKKAARALALIKSMGLEHLTEE